MLRAAAKSISFVPLRVVEAELSDSGAEDTFPPNHRNKISEDDFCVLGRALIIYVFEFSLEVILDHIVLLFRRCVSTN